MEKIKAKRIFAFYIACLLFLVGIPFCKIKTEAAGVNYAEILTLEAVRNPEGAADDDYYEVNLLLVRGGMGSMPVEIFPVKLTPGDTASINVNFGESISDPKLNFGGHIAIKDVSPGWIVDSLGGSGYKFTVSPDLLSTAGVEGTLSVTFYFEGFATTRVMNQTTLNFEYAVVKKESSPVVSVSNFDYGKKPTASVDFGSDATSALFQIYDFGDNLVDSANDINGLHFETLEVGGYFLVMTVPETTDYQEGVASCSFNVYAPSSSPTPNPKMKGSATVTAENAYVGTTPKISYTALDGMGAPTIYYVAADGTKTMNPPIVPGTYKVQCVFAENDLFTQTIAEADVTLSYLPAPSYSLKGSKGENGFYVSDVNIVAPDGYAISTTYHANYTDKVTMEKTGSTVVYFIEKSTGALSGGVNVAEIKIDKTSPTLVGSIKSGDVIYADEYEIEAFDENLSEVFVNGEAVAVVNNKATMTLYSGDNQTEYTIALKDLAGNEQVYELTISSPGLIKGLVPEGKKVTLMPDTEYEFGSGLWSMDGDSTVYAGGNTFYVPKKMTATFRKVN